MLAIVEWCWICSCAVYFWSPLGVNKNPVANAQYLLYIQRAMSLFLSERCVCTCLWSPYIKQIILTGKQRRTRWRDNRMNWRNPFSKLVLSIFSKQMSRIISSNASRDFQEHQRCVFGGIVQSWICWYKDSMVLKWCFEITEILSHKLTIKVDIYTLSLFQCV